MGFAKILYWLFLNLLLAPVYICLCALSFLLALSPLTPAKTARRNLRERLGLSHWRALVLTAFSLLNYAFTAVELLILGPLGATFRVNEKDCWFFLKEVADAYGLSESGRGLLFVGGHYAAIEEVGIVMNGFWVPFRGMGITAIAKPASFRLGTVIMDAYRRSRNLGVIWTGQSRSVGDQMTDVLLSGGAIGLVADQKARKGGLFLRFFGEYASFPFRGIELSQNLKLPCIAINVRRIIPGWFKVEYALLPPSMENSELVAAGVVKFESFQKASQLGTFVYRPAEVFTSPAIQLQNDQGVEGRTRHMMSHYVGWMETLIRKSPYQWCWDYRKWSRMPAVD